MHRRLKLLAMILFTWLIIILWRLTWVQVVQHDYYAALARKVQVDITRQLPVRGTIVDRDNHYLAYTLPLNSVYVDPKLFRKTMADRLRKSYEKLKREGKTSQTFEQYSEQTISDALRELAPLLGQSEADLRLTLSANESFVWLKRKMEPDAARRVKDVIEKYNLHGIEIRDEAERNYPNQELAAHLIGYVGLSNKGVSPGGLDTCYGVAGIEKQFDNFLQGKPGETEQSQDGRGDVYERRVLPPMDGAKIKLTIDSALQRKVEMLLAQAVREHRAKGASAVVMDPRTGEILAMANAPTFDPNRIGGDVSRNSAYLNQAVMLPYEPGSIFKVVTFAAAFEEGLITPDEMIDCGNGQITVGGRVIRDTHSYGRLTIEDAFAKSSNVGAIRIAQRLGRERFHRYIINFGFGAPTKIELPGEQAGVVHPAARWRPDSIGSVAIGQEVSVTLVQAVASIAAIANKGVLVSPHLVSEITTAVKGDVLYKPTIESRRVVSERTAELMTRILQRVVTDGTGRHAVQLSGYTAAGKTGTPQKSFGSAGYLPGRYMPSFLGFVPASEPRYAIVVMVDEPAAGSYYGGVVAAPIFARLAEAALGGADIAPDDPKYRQLVQSLQEKLSARPTEMDLSDGDEVMGGGQPEASGAMAPISYSLPAAAKGGEQVAPSVGTKPGRVEAGSRMPDLRGRGMRAVTTICSGLQLKAKIFGSGVAVRQSPAAGAMVSPGGECRVWLEQD